MLCPLSTSESGLQEIRKFHVAVMQRLLRNVENSVMHMQSCSFANVNLFLCAVLIGIAAVIAKTPYFCVPEILLLIVMY